MENNSNNNWNLFNVQLFLQLCSKMSITVNNVDMNQVSLQKNG